jgi:hypothetical protein
MKGKRQVNKSAKAKRFRWLIHGYDSHKKIFETKLSTNKLSVNQAEALLKTLAAKAGLTFDEIVGAYMKRKTKGSNVHLAIQRDVANYSIMCGNNPHFIAKIEPDE